MDSLLSTIQSSWSWTGIRPLAILETNAFGNVLFKAYDQRYYRLIPEKLCLEIVGNDEAEYLQVIGKAEFQSDWLFQNLYQQCIKKLGILEGNRVFYFVKPPAIGGAYSIENIQTNSLKEVISLSGDLALQIRDLPDGTEVTLVVK